MPGPTVPLSGRSPLRAGPRAWQVRRSPAGLWGRRRQPGPGLGLGPSPGPHPTAPRRRTGELLDGEAVKDLEGGVELERLAAALAHKADVRGAAARPRSLHRAARPRPAIAARRT